MIYMYTGDNEFIDHIEPLDNGYALFRNNNPGFTTVVANPSEGYRTIGSSLEFGGSATIRVIPGKTWQANTSIFLVSCR